MKKYGVTGATSHLGVALLNQLKNEGKFVRAIVKPGENVSYIKELCDEIVFADITEFFKLPFAFEDLHSVFHLAGIKTVGKQNRKLLREINVGGTKNVVTACMAAGVKKFVYASSVHAIEQKALGKIMHEPITVNHKRVTGEYAKSKALATEYILGLTYPNFEAVVCYHSGIIGPYAYKESHIGKLITDFCNNKIPFYFDGFYDYVDSRDVAIGLSLAEEKGKRNSDYVLSGQLVTVREMLDILHEQTGRPIPKYSISPRMYKLLLPIVGLYNKATGLNPIYTNYIVRTLTSGDQFSNYKARRELGFEPRNVKDSFRQQIQLITGFVPKGYEILFDDYKLKEIKNELTKSKNLTKVSIKSVYDEEYENKEL